MGFNSPWPDETQFTKSNFIAPVPPPYSFFFWQILALWGWSELAPTNAPVADEPVEAVFWMDENPILPARFFFFFFSTSSLPQNFPPSYLPPTSPCPTYHLPPPVLPTTYLPPPTYHLPTPPPHSITRAPSSRDVEQERAWSLEPAWSASELGIWNELGAWSDCSWTYAGPR